MSTDRRERPLRILHIILEINPTNGQYNEHCLPLMDERSITICTYFKSKITPHPKLKVFEGDDTVVGFFRALRAALVADEYDVIHVHTPHAGVLLLATLFLTGQYRKLKASTVHTIQNSYQNFKLRNKLLFIPSFPLFERLVFCSQASYDSFPSVFKWMGSGRMHVVQNAVDLARIDRAARSKSASQAGPFKIVSVGLIKMKNPATVLAAFRGSDPRDSQLVFLGKGEFRPYLEREIEESGLQEQVILTGIIGRDSVFEHFWQADLFVSASWGEGLPVAVLEAMACRCPVVLSDIPPHREIAEGVDFIPLIPPDDVAGFAREIERIRVLPLPERVKLGEQCRELIERRFSLRAMHAGYAEVYSQITSEFVPLGLERLA